MYIISINEKTKQKKPLVVLRYVREYLWDSAGCIIPICTEKM